ncbi:MAG: hypothetical protein AB7O52_13970 [Planctomycetota bacterium]
MKRFVRPSAQRSERDGSTVSRVRHHLDVLASGRGGEVPSGSMLGDLRSLLARLGRVHERGGDFQRIGLGPHLSEAMRALNLVGCELLVLAPEREGV